MTFRKSRINGKPV